MSAVLKNVKPLTEKEGDMHWEEIEELKAEANYRGNIYTAESENSNIIFICEEKDDPTQWNLLSNGAKFKTI